MKKLTTLIVVASLCLNFPANSQTKKPVCDPVTLSKCKYGFAGYKSGFKAETKLTPLNFGKWRRLISYNHTVKELYGIAYQLPFVNVIIDVRNPEKLEKKYCYELNCPPELVDNMFVIMSQHLQYEFPDYVATVIFDKGVPLLKIEDKDWGILVSGKFDPKIKNIKKHKDYTY